MRRSVLISAPALILSMISRAAFPGEPAAVADPATGEPGRRLPDFPLKLEALYLERTAPPTSSLGPLALLPPVSLGALGPGGGGSYLAVRAGPLFFIDDFKDLDTGFDLDVAYGFHPIPFLALEVDSGYLWGEDTGGTVEKHLWGVPIVGNAKVTIPVLLLKPYAGIGAGGFYIHTEEKVGALKSDESDFVLGWNAMVGVNFELGPLLVGVEGKYLHTDAAKTPSGRASLEGLALLAGVGIRF